MQRYATFATNALPYGVAAAVLSAALVRQPVAPGMAMSAGLLIGGVLAVLAALSVRDRRFTAPVGMLAVAGVACGVWFTITSLGAINPAVSIMGIMGQHNGTATWIMGLTWLLAAALVADKRSVKLMLLAVTGTGLAASVAALIEFFILDPEARSVDYARGFFENSVSFGQFLAIVIICTGAWALLQRDRRKEIGVDLIVLALVVMVGVSSSRTALLALAAAAAITWVMRKFPPTTPKARTGYAAALALSPAVLSAVGVASALGALGASAAGLMERLSNARDIIWVGAWSKLAQAPLTGFGLEQFSTWTSWTLTSDFIESDATTDPHSLAVAVGLGGGVLGLLLALAAFAALNLALVDSARTARSGVITTIATLPIAIAVAGSVGWIAPATMLVGTAVMGTVIGATAQSQKEPTPAWATKAVTWAALAVGAAAILMGLVGVRNVSIETRRLEQTDPTVLMELHRTWPDPALATTALQLLTPRIVQGDAAAAAAAVDVIAASSEDASWRVELTGAQLIASQALEASDPARFPEFEKIVAQGMKADPTSGLWYTFAAYEANRLELAEKAAEYARKALTFEVPEQTRLELEAMTR